MKARFLLPLAALLVLLILLGVGLRLNPREVPSPLIGKPAPAFSLPRLDNPDGTFSLQEMRGRVWMLNVWASWCAACRDEHETLVNYSRSGSVPLIGLNYKDERGKGLRWLKQLGNPYTLSAFDQDGRVGIDFGVYGVPETFIIDKKGNIRYKQIGAVTPEILRDRILPLLKQLDADV